MPPPAGTHVVTDQLQRRLIGFEVLVVLTVTTGLSAVRSALSLVESLLASTPLAEQQVALNASAARVELVDLALQLVRVLQLVGWGALGAYLLLRAGFALRSVGLDADRPGRDLTGATVLAAAIGVPGLALYLIARSAGVSADIAPTTLGGPWWELPVLIASAAGNAWAEEVVEVAYLLTRLRQLGWSENIAAAASAFLHGCYHLYQRAGGFVGNILMGLVFARLWQRTNRLWILVGAHTPINVVAFVGNALLAGRVAWS